MDFLEDLDFQDRKVREDTLALQVYLEFLLHLAVLTKEILETLVLMGSLASLDPEVTRVFQAFRAVRVFLDSLVLPSRVKDSPVYQASLEDSDFQGSQDQRVKLELLDFPALQEKGGMMVHRACLGTLGDLEYQELKACLVRVTVTREDQEPKVWWVNLATQVAEAMMEHPVTMVFQEFLVSLERRVLLGKEGGLE